ncbi:MULTISPECIES: MFS transporter [Bacillus cereus group]|uniref:Tetracycline resistance determinant TetV n=3 Tax=Bacillus cereus group TaxID=86661 RepID=R8QJS4_BACCE|nr:MULTISPECIES: MFS transporter [Bacillus cereus group]EOP71320.1 tetracycline resistance determinant TetV [Bacillus cereus VD118]MBJ7984333.1 MFS transporter [Bacillus cereus]MBJ8070356.1 MFS transporter [Bacillus cereus]MBJ8092098.1 MFS transporter [Bacillus cereus]MBJ8186549.1 MFS transporter [Bacillus cereus]
MGDVSIGQNDSKMKIATRNIMLMMIGKMTSLLGAGIYTFAMGLYVLKTTGSGMGFATTLICGSIPRMICGPIAGAVADRVNRRWLVIGTDLLSSLTMLIMFILATMFGPSLLFIYVSAALLSICASFYSVAVTSSIPNLVDEERIQKASALNQTAASLSNILAPIIGGVVFGFFSIKSFFLLNSITFFLAVIVQLFIVFDLYKKEMAESKEHFLTSIKEGFSYVKRQHEIYGLMKIAVGVNFFASALFVSLPYIIVQNLHLSSKQLGVVEGMLAVGMLIGAIVLSVRKEVNNPFRSVYIGLFLFAGLSLCTVFPLLVTIPKVVSFIYYIAFMILTGISMMVVNIPMQVHMQKTTDPNYLGRVFGLLETISTAIAPLGMIVYGLLLDMLPTSIVMMTLGGGLLLVVLVGVRKHVAKKQVDVSA